MPRPFLKWAGGKWQLLPQFRKFYPRAGSFRRYVDPFMGGGAVFFHVQALFRPERVMLSDQNADLIETYETVRDRLDDVIEALAEHKQKNCEDYYYEIREVNPAELDPVGRAARMIYLNKTCFNGLFRVNSRGLFNVPYGHRKTPGILDPDVLRAASRSFERVDFGRGHFRRVLDYARAGDFIYFDPPYDPVSATAKFTSYTEGSFGPEDQRELAHVYATLAQRGCLVMLSNSDTDFVRDLYREFRPIRTVLARRSINRDADGRGPVKEVVVLNYAPPRAASSSAAKAAKVGNRAADAPA